MKSLVAFRYMEGLIELRKDIGMWLREGRFGSIKVTGKGKIHQIG